MTDDCISLKPKHVAKTWFKFVTHNVHILTNNTPTNKCTQ